MELLQSPNQALPSEGNKVDHMLLFDGSIKGPAATPARIWRKSPQTYDSIANGELAKNTRGIAQPFSSLTGNGIKDFAAAFTVDESSLGQLMRNAELIVQNQTRGELVDGKWVSKGYPQPVKEFVALLQPENQPLSRELKDKAVAKQFQLILRRSPTEEELDRYRLLMDRLAASSDLVTAVRSTLSAVLLTPEAIFRFELGEGEVDAFGRQLLAPREIAFALGYALTDKGPDDQLLRLAAEGKLSDPKVIEAEVDRMLDSPKISTPRIPRFFREYFGYHRADEVFKDSSLNPHHQAKILIEDTDQLVAWIVERDENVFEELLTTNLSFVNYRVDRNKKRPLIARSKSLVHTSYGLPIDWKWTPQQPIAIPKAERAGILTQPSWLVTQSGNFDNHPIHRGKWVRERLLGGTIPDLPITVDAQLPEEPENPLRHRMRVTREQYCWNCHQRMNPLGLAFETYDHFGRFRTLETLLDKEATQRNVDSKGRSRGDVLKQVALDAGGKVDLVGDANVEREFDDAVDMLHHLAKTDRARQMFVRYTFRFFLGRNEELSDSPTLIAADQAYINNGGSFRSLIKSLLTSDSFLYRMSKSKPANDLRGER